jgi:hypothetical protein
MMTGCHRNLAARQRLLTLTLAASMLTLGMAGRAQAGIISLNGQGTMSVPSFQFLNPTGTGNVETNNNTTYALTVPGQYVYTDTLTSPESLAQSLQGTSGTGTYGFQDSDQFSLNAGATGDILEATLSFGSLSNISNLQIRLYGWTTGSPAPTVGNIPAGTTSYSNWTGIPAGMAAETVDFGPVPQGNYILDIRGTATGSIGGTYVGQLNVAPVPIPAGLPLLFSGLGVLGGLFRRRRIGSEGQ